MSIRIGAAIARMRREKGITQEQLAEAIGVSAPAVSKWETGQSYPDITLLPPLTRYFGVPVDALLAYEAVLTEEEREKLGVQALETFARDGWPAGLAFCEGLLREYPSDMELRIYLTGTLMGSLVFARDDAERAEGREKQVAWLQEAAQATEGKTQLMAQSILAAFYMQTRRFDEAEAILAGLEDIPENSRKMMATLRMLQGENEEAMRLAQKNLMIEANSLLVVLGTMTSIAVKFGEMDKGLVYADAAKAVLETIGAADSHLAHSGAQAAVTAAHAAKDVRRLLSATEWYVDTMLDMRQPDGVFFDALAKEEAVPTPDEQARNRAMYGLLMEDFTEGDAYDVLREEPRFQALLSRLQTAVKPQ